MIKLLKKVSLGVYYSVVNQLFKIEKPLWKKRLKLCKTCPNNHGGICSNNFYLAKDGDFYIVIHEKDSKKNESLALKMNKGCGCVLKYKTKLKDESCPINIW